MKKEVEEKKISNVMTDKTIAASIELSGIQIQKLLKELNITMMKFQITNFSHLYKKLYLYTLYFLLHLTIS